MGIYEFNVLNEDDKFHMVFNHGQFIDYVPEGEIRYVLYSYSNFWVEIEYDFTKKDIINIASFVSGKMLDRYSNVPDVI